MKSRTENEYTHKMITIPNAMSVFRLLQMTVLICLVIRFPMVLVLAILFAIKEFTMGITGLLVIRKTGKVYGADWHGKVNPFLLYLIIAIHVV